MGKKSSEKVSKRENNIMIRFTVSSVYRIALQHSSLTHTMYIVIDAQFTLQTEPTEKLRWYFVDYFFWSFMLYSHCSMFNSTIYQLPLSATEDTSIIYI